ncbi:GNAT family N-acetyltransferase [Piscinibacter sakaiensis]|uniref:GNAT family N-acetyltransferase n=1 Tax=Piscinibacter sakaiensis TaxID=1547922 RepID=UPI00372AB458
MPGLDGWLLRLLPAKAKRARCVNAVARGRLPLDEKLARAAAACRAAGVPLVVRITPFTEPPELEAELAARGWGRLDDTRVMWRSGLDTAPAAALPDGLRLVATDPAHYAEQVGAWRGTPPPQRRAHAARLQVSPVPYRAWLLQADGGQALAGGQIACEDDLVGLYDVYTAPPARGRGLARALCSRLIAAAAAEGARHAYLQVEHDNLAARAVYHRLGFRDAYAYHYRAPAGGELPAGAGG